MESDRDKEIYDYEYADDEGEEEMDFNVATRKDARALSNNACCICHLKVVQTFHHLKPKEEGGEGDLDNCVPVCSTCSRFIHAGGLNRTQQKNMRNGWYELVKYTESDVNKNAKLNEINEDKEISQIGTFQSTKGHKSPEAKKQWQDEEEKTKKRIKDWLYFHTVWYKDMLRGHYIFDDWRTTEEINNLVNVGKVRVRNFCEMIEAIERDTKDQASEKWRIKESYYDKFDGDEVFEKDY